MYIILTTPSILQFILSCNRHRSRFTFGTLNLYPNNVDWSGKVIDYDVEFYFSIGEDNGVYINGDMIKLDDGLVELINKLTSFYDKFKAKWAKVLSQRKKTKNIDAV